jgi:predicted RNA-binding Zn ribbon-like protein
VTTVARARKLPNFSTFQGLLTATQRALDSDAVHGVLSELPDEDAATRSLNARLALLRLRLEYDAPSGAWHIQPGHHTSSTTTESDNALLGLARLIEADGWHRIKTCQSPGCSRPYIDLTNGTIRKFCDAHRAGPRYREH